MFSANHEPASRATPDGRLLHRLLGTGLTLVAAAFFFFHYLDPKPLLPASDAPLVAYGILAASLTAVAAAWLIVKPRVPARRPGQSVPQYWSTSEVMGAANLFWFVMEAGCMLSAVGYLLTADPVAAAVMLIAVAAFWLSGPNLFGQK